MRTLVVQTAYLGDTVFTSALVDGLSRAGHEVELCVSPRGREVAQAIPGARAVHVFDKRAADKGLRGLRRIAASLRGRFDLAVLPHRSLRSGALAWLARIPRRVGFAGAPGSIFYTERVRAEARGFLAAEGKLLAALGAPEGRMRLVPPDEWVEAGRRVVGTGSAAALCVGSEWATKIWPVRQAGELARALTAKGLRPVLLGGPREKALADAVRAVEPSAIDTTGNSVAEALGILSRCVLCVGGDTGLVHAARALGVPTVALFGPTPLDVHRFGARERAVSLGLSCSPCSAHGGRRCPLGHHRCLQDLDAGRVARACEAVLA